jgi:hypothetical protein
MNIYMNKCICAIAVLLWATSCAFNSDREDDGDKEKQVIQENYQAKCAVLEGFYTGSIRANNSSYPAEVGVYCEPKELPDKKDSMGQPITVMAPNLVIIRTDSGQRDRFEISYDMDSGAIKNSSATSSLNTGQFDETILSSIVQYKFSSFDGQLRGSQIIGDLVTYGILDVTRDPSKIFSLSDQVSLKKMVNSVANNLSRFEGKFCGHFKVRNSDPIPFFNAELIVTMQKLSELSIRMVGRYKVKESSGVLDRPTKFYFDLDDTLLKVTVDSVVTFAGSYHFVMNGTLNQDDFYGTYTEDIGTIADFYMLRMNYTTAEPPKKCFDEAKKKLNLLLAK